MITRSVFMKMQKSLNSLSCLIINPDMHMHAAWTLVHSRLVFAPIRYAHRFCTLWSSLNSCKFLDSSAPRLNTPKSVFIRMQKSLNSLYVWSSALSCTCCMDSRALSTRICSYLVTLNLMYAHRLFTLWPTLKSSYYSTHLFFAWKI